MLNNNEVQEIKNQGRRLQKEDNNGEKALGPLQLLPGTWKNEPNLPGRGWNMIALPFAEGEHGYRVLSNQYNEELTFNLVDNGVPNRGLQLSADQTDNDQLVATLDYVQSVTQIAAADSPESGEAGASGLAIHHEPGLWLHMLNNTTQSLDIARLASVPHGNSVLALGKADIFQGAPDIPTLSGLPEGIANVDLSNPYLAPYKHFHDNKFENIFDPTSPNDLLQSANQGVDIVRTTQLNVTTDVETAGISSIPFVTKQANATQMNSTFWIQELAEKDSNGNPKLRLQYTQTIFLEFFDRTDGKPGKIRWPHVSINTLEKVVD